MSQTCLYYLWLSFYANRSAQSNYMESANWNLNFNVAKCALLWFSSGYPPTAFNYILNGDLISAQVTHKDLGIIMSSYLSWRERKKNILSRAYKTLNHIRYSFSSGHSPQTKKILYLSLVHSQLTYCSQIWHLHLLKVIIILEKIQHRATKYILNYFTSDYIQISCNCSQDSILAWWCNWNSMMSCSSLEFWRDQPMPSMQHRWSCHLPYWLYSPQVETCFVKN